MEEGRDKPPRTRQGGGILATKMHKKHKEVSRGGAARTCGYILRLFISWRSWRLGGSILSASIQWFL